MEPGHGASTSDQEGAAAAAIAREPRGVGRATSLRCWRTTGSG